MRRLKGVLITALVLCFTFLIFGAVWAEEPVSTSSLVDEGQIFGAYNEYQYPSGNRMFYLPRRHEVKFDIHNGAYFMIRYWPTFYQTIPTSEELWSSDYKVFFYTPTGKLFGIRRIKNLDYDRYHSIPHNDRSPNYERLIVKVQNNTEYNKDFLLKVLDPVDPVKGTPIKGTKYRVILLD